MKTNRSLVALCLTVILVAGCATVAPTADPVLVRAQQSYATAVNTCDLLFNIELDNRTLIESKLPGTHATVDKIKTQAKTYLPKLLSAIDTYAAAKTAANASTLTAVLAVVEAFLASAQDLITKVGVVPPKPVACNAFAIYERKAA
jgi:uncharacterized lipoprotein